MLPKVIDTFIYNGDPILNLRLHLLFPVVDEFFLVEAEYTHSGLKKEELFVHKHAALLEAYSEKVTIVIVPQFPTAPTEWLEAHKGVSFMQGGLKNWFRETYHRDYVQQQILDKYKGSPFILLACDVDEIPKPNVVEDIRQLHKELRCKGPVHLSMEMFYYNFAWVKKSRWCSAFVLTETSFTSDTSLSTIRTGQPQTIIPDAGWHASFFFNLDGIQRKLRSFAHQEYCTEQTTDKTYIQKCMREGKDLFQRKGGEELIFYDKLASLPVAVQRFQEVMLFLQEYS